MADILFTDWVKSDGGLGDWRWPMGSSGDPCYGIGQAHPWLLQIGKICQLLPFAHTRANGRFEPKAD